MKTNILQTAQIRRHSFSAAFAIALLTGLGAGSLLAQGPYYPPSNWPIDSNANLQAIEGHLASGATLFVPAPAGKHVATDAEISAALSAALIAQLAAPAGGISIDGLVNEISKYRPTKTGNWATAAVGAIIHNDTGNVLGDLELVTTAAVTPNPKNAATVVKSSIKLIAVPGSSSALDLTSDDIVAEAVAAAPIYTNKIVAAAMGAAKKLNALDLANVEQDIVSEAVQESVAAGAAYLLDQTLTAAEKSRAPGISSKDIAAAAFKFRADHDTNPGGATGVALDNLTIGLVAGGAMRGAGAAEVSNIVTGVDGATGGTHTNYITNVGAGFNAAAVSSDATVSAPAVLASINASNKDYIPAILQGAVEWLNRNDTGLLGGPTGALKKNETLSGASSVQDIVEAVVLGVQKDVKKIAVSAVSAVDAAITLHDITQGAARGADVSLIGATAGAVIKAAGVSTPHVQEIVDGSIAGAVDTSKNSAIGDIALQATKASKLGSVVVVQAVTSSPVGDTYRAVAGAVAGDKKNATAIALAGKGARIDDDDTANGLAADTVVAIQLSPKTAFNTVLSQLSNITNSQLIDTQAIVTGAGLANPKGAQATAAAAISLTSFDADTIIAEAQQTNRKLAFNIGLAGAAAVHVKADPNDLFDYISHASFQNAKFSADIATGATVAAPQYTHVIAHAAAFGAPANAGKLVPVLFAYSQLDNHLAHNINNPVAAAAAITAGVTCGILETKSTKELNYVKAAVSAAVKSAAALEGNGDEGAGNFHQSDGGAGTFTSTTQKGAAGVITGYVSESVNVGQTDIPGGATGLVGTVIAAAVKADKKDALAIAQAAATAAATISGAPGAYIGAALATAILNGGAAVTLAQIQNAIAFGRDEAVAGRLGAGALGVSSYLHYNCTGSPVTSIFNL
jgi:hypothetical protein